MSDSEQFSAQRRRVLLGMAATGAAIAGSSLSCPAMAAAAEQVTTAPRSDKTQDHQDFFGKHQSGIVTPRPACGCWSIKMIWQLSGVWTSSLGLVMMASIIKNVGWVTAAHRMPDQHFAPLSKVIGGRFSRIKSGARKPVLQRGKP